jgi:hypothetical protein
MLLILYIVESAYACSSFAVYSDNKFYGMNFDWSDTDVNMSIEKVNGIKRTCSSNNELQVLIFTIFT